MASDDPGRAYPRLFTIVVAGTILITLGAGLALVDVDWLPLRLGVLGAMILIFGLAGYVAIGVFQRQPGS